MTKVHYLAVIAVCLFISIIYSLVSHVPPKPPVNFIDQSNRIP